MNHFAVYQKQHCKATILQLKINKIHQTFIDLSLCARQYSECLVCISSFNPQKPHHCPLIKKETWGNYNSCSGWSSSNSYIHLPYHLWDLTRNDLQWIDLKCIITECICVKNIYICYLEFLNERNDYSYWLGLWTFQYLFSPVLPSNLSLHPIPALLPRAFSSESFILNTGRKNLHSFTTE